MKDKSIGELKTTYGHHPSCIRKVLSGSLKDAQIYFCKFLNIHWYYTDISELDEGIDFNPFPNEKYGQGFCNGTTRGSWSPSQESGMSSKVHGSRKCLYLGATILCLPNYSTVGGRNFSQASNLHLTLKELRHISEDIVVFRNPKKCLEVKKCFPVIICWQSLHSQKGTSASKLCYRHILLADMCE